MRSKRYRSAEVSTRTWRRSAGVAPVVPGQVHAGQLVRPGTLEDFGQGVPVAPAFPGSLGPGSPGFRHHRHRPPRGYSPAGVDAAPDTVAGARVGPAPSEQIRWVQFMLNGALGLNLPTDGIMSPELRDALRTFQGKQGLPTSGFIGPDTIAALQSGGGQQSAAPAEGGEFEYFGELELKPAEAVAEAALADTSKATSIDKAVKGLAKGARGLYRLFHPSGRFYTGMSTDLRSRIIHHAWCLTHLGKSVKPWRVDGLRHGVRHGHRHTRPRARDQSPSP